MTHCSPILKGHWDDDKRTGDQRGDDENRYIRHVTPPEHDTHERAMSCIIPEYAIGIRAFRAHASDAFAQPRCFKHAMHGVAIGEWVYQDGKRIALWERVTP